MYYLKHFAKDFKLPTFLLNLDEIIVRSYQDK